MMNNEFYIAFEGFMKSLLITNPWFLDEQIPMIIIDLNIKTLTKEKMLQLYPYIEFRHPVDKNYLNINMSKTPEVLKCTYKKLEVFSYYDFDRVVFIDLDTTIVGDIRGLFEVTTPFAACYGYNLQADKLRHDINSGVFVRITHSCTARFFKS